MSFNLKKRAASPNINDQSSLDSYLQMLITQLNEAGTIPTEDALAEITNMNNLSAYGIDSFTELQKMIQQQMEIIEQQQQMQNQMVSPPTEPGAPVIFIQ